MFYFPISHQDIAKQIAGLLNDYNGLSVKRTSQDILHSKTNYVAETHGRFVIGVAGIQKISYQMSEFKHMVVHPGWRGKGLGRFVAKRALQICETPLVYATVRTTNVASLKALEKIEFRRVEEFPAGDHKLALLVRVAPKWENDPTKSKSHSWSGIDWESATQSSLGLSLGLTTPPDDAI